MKFIPHELSMKCIFHGIHVNHGILWCNIMDIHGAQLVHRGVCIINYLALHGSLKMCSMHLELTATDFLYKLLVIYTCMLIITTNIKQLQ